MKARIKAIRRRTAKRKEEPAGSPVLVKGNMKIDCDGRRVFIGEREINLTAKEFDVADVLHDLLQTLQQSSEKSSQDQ